MALNKCVSSDDVRLSAVGGRPHGRLRSRELKEQEEMKVPTKEVAPLSRYTNLMLNHVWEKFDCQATLLSKEALLVLGRRNPQLLDAESDFIKTVRLSMMKPKSSPQAK